MIVVAVSKLVLIMYSKQTNCTVEVAKQLAGL